MTNIFSRRITAIFCVAFLFSAIIFFRVFSLSMGSASAALSQVANSQSSYTIKVDSSRGAIYDCHLKGLVSNAVNYKAAVVPSTQAAGILGESVAGHTSPFVTNLETAIYSPYFETIKCQTRYSDNTAVHIIGHLDGDGEGAYGIERAFNDYLSENSGALYVKYKVDGLRRVLSSTAPKIVSDNYNTKSGVVLSLDRDVQSIVETVARKHIKSGAVVVMEVGTGAIRACVSLPEFDQNNISADLENELYPFVNRAFSAHNVGSTFKLLVAALGLENDYPTGYTYECEGWINIGGQTFTCQNHSLPKVMDMKTALETSCNTYFIFLSKVLSANRLLPYAKLMHFGDKHVFSDNYQTSSGTLPTLDDLMNPAELANFSFGQGIFTATPIQIAAMVGAIANDGFLPYPYLIEGYTTDGESISERVSHPAQTSVMTRETARRIKSYMVSVVENGSGENAYLEDCGAGGKTASAQTGKKDENGVEIVDAWFSGFFPADNPKYVIVVLNEGMSSGGKYAAPVFKEIAQEIQLLEKYR